MKIKKVLIIANLFHASPRIPGVAIYLPEFGWEATILTIPLSEEAKNYLGLSQKFFKRVKIIETPYRGDIFWFWRKIFKFLGFDITKSILNQVKQKIGITSKGSFVDSIFNFYRTIFAYPDEEKEWKKPALKVASKFLEKEKIDAIISSSSPVTAHIIAKELKKKYEIPWVADFRDLWTQNHNYPYSRWRKIFERRLEIKTLRSADALVTVSEPWVERLKELHQKEKVYTITNGFDPNKINNPPINLTNKFTITYTGQIYLGKQDPLKVLIALKDLITEKIIDPNKVEVRVYGPEENWLKKEIKKYGLSSIMKQYGVIPREISLKRQWESQLLLLLNWENLQEKGVYPLKIFEYLAAQRPILATGGFGSDVVKKLLNETKAGVYCSKVEDIKNSLRKFYLEYKHNGKVRFNGDIEKINKYSHREMAKKFADILNRLI
jgi:hypothetical protein